MRFITKLSLRMRSLLRRKAVDAELNEELRSHLERQIAQNLAVGMSRDEARYAALANLAASTKSGKNVATCAT